MLVLVALLSGVGLLGAATFPRHVAWRGTMLDGEGHLMDLRLRTRLKTGRDIDPSFVGRIRCRGDACPFHRGSVEAFPDRGAIAFVSFGRFSRTRDIYCTYVDQTPDLPALAIEGPYDCELLATKTHPQQQISAGTLSLAVHRPR